VNVQKGAARVSLLLIPYMGWWGWRGYSAAQDQVAAEQMRSAAMRAGSMESESAWFYSAQASGEVVKQSLLWGLYVPVGIIAGALLMWWVYSGSRSNE